jgi:alpha-beta hydrolase superfamily lysophospholipase
VRRLRSVNVPLPAEIATSDGLSYSLWMPAGRQGPPRTGVVILHGAGSCKESHHDFARVVIGGGLAAIVFDQRGHGASEGPMDGRAVEDVAAMADVLRRAIGDPDAPLALRGSSMGGFLAILAAPAVRAGAVVAICPASAEGLRRGLASGALRFDADTAAVDRILAVTDLSERVSAMRIPLLLMHAEGDEQVPIAHSRELAARLTVPESRLIAVPGGHHRSIQHDHEFQAVSLRFIQKALAA